VPPNCLNTTCSGNLLSFSSLSVYRHSRVALKKEGEL